MSRPLDDDRLIDLLIRWEDLRRGGTDVDLAILCRDHPELLEGLKLGVRRLQGIGALLRTGAEDIMAQQRARTAVKVLLVVTKGPHKGRSFEFFEHDNFIVGRSKHANFRLPVKDKTFSRYQFLVEVNPPHCRLLDMASTNGTFVNGRRVQAANLKEGDVIKGGRTVLTVTIRTDDPATCDTPIRSPISASRPAPATGNVPGADWSVPGYRIEHKLGSGGMGVVFLARRETDGMRVALKTITPASEGSPDAVERFLREASILRQLDHPNIVQFREVGSSAGRLFFAMEFVPGLDGSEMIKKNGGPLPVVRAVRLIHQALDGLAYAHDRGFVHRDIKPTNLLIGDEGGTERAKLADFGLARIYHTSPLSGLTLTGQFGGTYGFIAPEQITNYRDVKPATDQYSVGATLYTMLTGEKIYDFRGGIAQQILTVLQEDPVPVRERRSDIPEALAAVVHRALARDPASRYPGADAMRRALDPFLGGG